MNKQITFLIHLFCMFISLSLIGCSLPQQLQQQELTKISSITVARLPTPEVHEITLGRTITGAVVAGGLGAYLMQGEVGQPEDFGGLVMKEFYERVSKEVPNWPQMSIEATPVTADYKPQSDGLLLFEVFRVDLTDLRGLIANITVTLKKSDGQVLWRKPAGYISSKYDRDLSIDEFRANNNKRLSEEFKFAANKIVSELLNDINPH